MILVKSLTVRETSWYSNLQKISLLEAIIREDMRTDVTSLDRYEEPCPLTGKNILHFYWNQWTSTIQVKIQIPSLFGKAGA